MQPKDRCAFCSTSWNSVRSVFLNEIDSNSHSLARKNEITACKSYVVVNLYTNSVWKSWVDV